MSSSPAPVPRQGLVGACLGHAAVFGWAAAVLPWRSGTQFAVLCSILAALHVATAVVALLPQRALLVPVWRALSVASLLVFLVMGWSMAAAALYVSKLYVSLGASVCAVIVFAAILLGFLTLPMAIWGARATWPERFLKRSSLAKGAGVVLVVCVFTLPLVASSARAAAIPGADAQLASRVTHQLEIFEKAQAEGEPRSVAGASAAICKHPVSPDRLTLLVSFASGHGAAKSSCLQAPSQAPLIKQLDKLLHGQARAGSTVVVDVVKAAKPLSSGFPLLDAFEIRPGLDGVCSARRCLTPWQLTLVDVFSENHPIASVPDASFGFSAPAVRKALGLHDPEANIDGLIRIETESYSADAQGIHRLVRTRATPPSLSPSGVQSAVQAAEGFITAAQEEDGSFRYSIDPWSGDEDRATMNLPRQAGTTYALCELGTGPNLQQVVARALGAFGPSELKLGKFSALGEAQDLGLGKSALPLLAMLRCRSLVGPENDRIIGQLSRLMLRLQRENGSFYPALDRRTKKGAGQYEILYAAGQAVLSLVLLEQQLEALHGGAAEPLPSAGELKSVIDRAMNFYAGPYWPRPLRDFFFFEEGWHCQAARHALTSHRNDGYEQFCIDYVSSRERFITRERDTNEPNFVGGYGMSDLFPPRNTATAGIGEALDAAIVLKQKRGLSVERDKEILRDLVTFLLRAQWSEADCYACRKPADIVGGFSQQLASPGIRIDYVQHAMSAIGQGGKLLF